MKYYYKGMKTHGTLESDTSMTGYNGRLVPAGTLAVDLPADKQAGFHRVTRRAAIKAFGRQGFAERVDAALGLY